MRKITFILLFILVSLTSFGQKWKLTRYEAFAAVGVASYFGDIGGSASSNNMYGIKDISLFANRPSLMIGARYKLKQNMNLKLSLTGLMLGASDEGSRNENTRGGGGFSFNSYGFEHSLQFEYAFIAEDMRQRSFALFNRRGMLNNFSKKSLYVFGGVGGLAFLPNFKGTPTKVDIVQKNFQYTAVFPVGIGAKMIYNNNYALGVEFGFRYSLSDYLDGVTSTFSQFNDFYYFTSFHLIYRIKTSRQGYPILFKNY